MARASAYHELLSCGLSYHRQLQHTAPIVATAANYPQPGYDGLKSSFSVNQFGVSSSNQLAVLWSKTAVVPTQDSAASDATTLPVERYSQPIVAYGVGGARNAGMLISLAYLSVKKEVLAVALDAKTGAVRSELHLLAGIALHFWCSWHQRSVGMRTYNKHHPVICNTMITL